MRLALEISYDITDDDEEKKQISNEIVEEEANKFIAELVDHLERNGMEIEQLDVKGPHPT